MVLCIWFITTVACIVTILSLLMAPTLHSRKWLPTNQVMASFAAINCAVCLPLPSLASFAFLCRNYLIASSLGAPEFLPMWRSCFKSKITIEILPFHPISRCTVWFIDLAFLFLFEPHQAFLNPTHVSAKPLPKWETFEFALATPTLNIHHRRDVSLHLEIKFCQIL